MHACILQFGRRTVVEGLEMASAKYGGIPVGLEGPGARNRRGDDVASWHGTAAGCQSVASRGKVSSNADRDFWRNQQVSQPCVPGPAFLHEVAAPDPELDRLRDEVKLKHPDIGRRRPNGGRRARNTIY